MKVLLLIVLVSSGFCFGQENPWAPKGENPWKAYPQQENKPADTALLVKTDVDSVSHPLQEEEIRLSENEVYVKGQNMAGDVYKSGGNFAFGFLTGICFNLFGIVPDLIYIAPNFKSEKRATEKVINKMENENCDRKKLEKKVENKIKSKKALSTIGGTLTGAATQIGIGLILIIL